MYSREIKDQSLLYYNFNNSTRPNQSFEKNQHKGLVPEEVEEVTVTEVKSIWEWTFNLF